MKSLLSFVQHQQALMPNKLKRLKRRLCSLMMSLYSRLSTVLTVMMTSLTEIRTDGTSWWRKENIIRVELQLWIQRESLRRFRHSPQLSLM